MARSEYCIVCKTLLAPFLKCAQGTVLRCNNCGLGALENIPETKKLFKYYTSFYDEQKSERFKPLFELAIRCFRELRVRVVEHFAKKRGRILDVGFGRPIDLSLFQQRGWEAHGTQIVPHTVRVARSQGLNAFLGELHDAKYPDAHFDMITVWHVLEHLKNPAKYVREMHRILKPEGRLIVEVPNFNSPLARMFGCNWLGLDLPHHLYHFTPKSLTRLLHQNGFKVVKTKFFSLEQSPFSALQTLLNALTGQRNVLFESIKTQGEKAPLSAKVLNAGLAVLLAPIAIIVSAILGIACKGDIMRFYCIKK